MVFKSVVKQKGIEFLSLTPEQCGEMVDAYFRRGGNEYFESQAFDLFIEYPQNNPRVEKFRQSCEELISAFAANEGGGQDFWQIPEGRRVLSELMTELRST